MEMYDFTYRVPDGLHDKLIRFLQQNVKGNISQLVQRCKIDHEDVGFAYYAGLSGDNWNKRALDFTFEGTEDIVNELKKHTKELKNAIQKILKPGTSGFLVRNIEYIISNDELELILPEEQGETFETLSNDIYDALRKSEPTLVLDRLHTYSSKFLREICAKHQISIAGTSGDYYPLHSLMGMLTKYYNDTGMFESDFVYQTLKMSISLFDKYNTVRNNKSYAHDNDVLNKAEATYVVSVVTATLKLINEVEQI